jgi:hypothetical protein
MTQRHLNRDKTPPLWAVLGAPLIGVPLMVALIALSAPKVEAPAPESAPALVTEPVDTHVVEPVLNDSASRLEQEFTAG